jgi:atypical dual specificity phosphatase
MNTGHEHKPGDPLDYNYIADGIYAGTNQCCALGLVDVLKKEGITADISLEDARLDNPYGVEMYAWIPTADNTPPTRDQLTFGVQVLQELVRQKRKVYVHCKNGHGRTSTLLATYFISQGSTVDKAIGIIKAKRPAIHLQESQKEALKIFTHHKEKESPDES